MIGLQQRLLGERSSIPIGIEIRPIRGFVTDVSTDQGVNRIVESHHVQVATIDDGAVGRKGQPPLAVHRIPQEGHVFVRFGLALRLV